MTSLLGASLSLAACKSCGRKAEDAGPARAAHGRLIVLGFDGVDPQWLERWASEGKLPSLQRLREAQGGAGYRRLRSSNPPQSPVAWTSFATGTLPGEHGIFDFIGRALPPQGMPVLPRVATTSFEPRAGEPPVAVNHRSGVPFWKTLADEEVRVVALNVPYSFPPDPMRNGRILSGLGVPDLRETNSTFTYVGTDVTTDAARRPPGGGVLVPLSMEGDRGRFDLEGPSIPGTSDRMRIPIALERRTGTEPALSLRIAGRDVVVSPGEMSDFVELTFEHDGTRVRGLARFLAIEVSPTAVRLFITPIGFHPREPYSPFSYPVAYATRILEGLGHFYTTVGWDHDTNALNAEVVDDGVFLAEMDRIETDRRAMLEDALAADDFDLLIWVSTATDRVAHMFYRLIDPEHPRYDAALAARYGDAIERQYRRMDETVARVLERLRPDDTLLILSDHGFHNYRRGLHVNQWLRQQGFLALLDDAAEGPDLFRNVDWSRTQAYALGTGQIYLNLRRREHEGIVSADDAPAILGRIREGLLALRDEERGGAQVIREVYLGRDVYRGGRASDAPDLQVAFAEYYRTSWETILGGTPAGLFADNTKKWSGDHAASDVEETPGILLANRPLVDHPAIVDLAPTAVGFFGVEIPRHYAGRSVLREAASR